MRTLFRWLSAACLLFLLFPAAPSAADSEKFALVGNKDVPDTLDKEDVKQIFLGKRTFWDQDRQITFVIFSKEGIFNAFLKVYIGKTMDQYKNYWKKQVFTGKGRMPKAFEQSSDLSAYIAETSGAIGFLPEDDVNPEIVKLITIKW